MFDALTKIPGEIADGIGSAFTTIFKPVVGLEHEFVADVGWVKKEAVDSVDWMENAWIITSEFVSSTFHSIEDVTSQIWYYTKLILTGAWNLIEDIAGVISYLVSHPVILVGLLVVIGYVAWSLMTVRYVHNLD